MAGITIGSFALITILSAFNGFEDVVSRLFNTFDSDLKIVPQSGKYFHLTEEQLNKIRNLPDVQALTPVIEENALLKYRNQQTIATFKAIEPEYLKTTGIDSMVLIGDPVIKEDAIRYALIGAGVSVKLDLHGRDDYNAIQVFIPKKGVTTVLNPERAFNRRNILPSGIFSIQQEFDNRYVILPVSFARELLDIPEEVTSYEINVLKEDKIEETRKAIVQLLGKELQVQDRYQQQPLLYKVMKTEKFAVYLILSFIMLIAAFNLVGALIMLAIEKKKDMMVLISMGARPRIVENIILFEGLLLSLGGALAGILLGFIVCLLQMKFGFVKISEGSTFVIDAYPIAFKLFDFVLVLVTVVVLGFLASYYPAKTAYKRLSIQDLRR